MTRLIDAIAVHETSFFRISGHFKGLETLVFPALFQNLNAGKTTDIRIWSAGCSTGEEAYSLAILCCEVVEQEDLNVDIKIFATDVDREAIVSASAGVFAESAVADIEPVMLSKYFYRKDEGFYISRQVREMAWDQAFFPACYLICRIFLLHFLCG